MRWIVLLLLVPLASAQSHPPISIHGDDEVCLPTSGVVNCETADGSPENPYIIEGWTIREPIVGPGLLVSIMSTDAHILMRNVSIAAVTQYPLTIDASNVSLQDVVIGAGVQAVAVRDAQASFDRVDLSGRGNILLSTGNAILTINNSAISGGGTAIHASGTLRLENSTVSDGKTRGLSVFSGSATVKNVTFARNGEAGYVAGVVRAGTPGDVVVASLGSVRVKGSTFHVATQGVALLGSATMAIDTTEFTGGDAFYVDASADCAIQASYNAFLGMRPQARLDNQCPVDFVDSWWGQPGGPPDGWAEPGLSASSWLTKPLDALPTVEVEAFMDGAQILMRGTTEAPMVRIDGPYSTLEVPAGGDFEARVPAQAPLIIQACAVSCGVPVEVNPVFPTVSQNATLPWGWLGLAGALLLIGGAVAGLLLRPKPDAELQELHDRIATVLPAATEVDVQDMVLGLAHDLKGPLAGIIAMLQVAEREARGGAPVEDLLHEALTGSQNLKNLVLDLLDMARAGAEPAMAPTDLRDVIHGSLSHLSIPQHVQIHVEGPPLQMHTDGARLGRAVLNLVENSLRYLPTDRPGHVDVAWTSNDGVQVVVRDNGPGLPAAIERNLWEPFNSSNREGSTGLGLSIVKTLVASLGGTVGYRKRGGVEFVIRLP